MKIRSLSPLAVALGVWAGDVAAKDAAQNQSSTKTPAAMTPAKTAPAATPGNQQLADAIATRLMNSSAAEGADVGMSVEEGVVTVSGAARDAAQKAAILREVSVVPGVKLVRDGMTTGGLMQAQALGVAPPAGPFAAMAPVGAYPGPNGPVVEPVPVGAPGSGGHADGFAPPLPPHAWPTYAPYNNVSRVGYPQAYPHNAFPFIGPFYPFPKVPLGWRSVKLEWEDGHWWMGRTAAPYDYWRVRFW